MFLAVALGALGAHALESRLEASDMLDVWHTAVLYHLVHALALLVAGLWAISHSPAANSSSLKTACWCWIAGIILFSGSLYALALGAPRWLGPVTPLGGICLLAGWGAMAVTAIRAQKPKSGP